MRKPVVIAAAVVAALAFVPACSSSPATATAPAAGASAAQSPVEAIKAGTATIDVRTPAEFSAGHVKGAKNIDVQAATFDAEVGKLDKSKTYVVYCKSGNRSAQAITKMKALGFTSLIDGKGFDALRQAGVEVAAES